VFFGAEARAAATYRMRFTVAARCASSGQASAVYPSPRPLHQHRPVVFFALRSYVKALRATAVNRVWARRLVGIRRPLVGADRILLASVIGAISRNAWFVPITTLYDDTGFLDRPQVSSPTHRRPSFSYPPCTRDVSCHGGFGSVRAFSSSSMQQFQREVIRLHSDPFRSRVLHVAGAARSRGRKNSDRDEHGDPSCVFALHRRRFRSARSMPPRSESVAVGHTRLAGLAA